MFTEMGIFKAKPAPVDLLPEGISHSYPNVALLNSGFCTEQNMQAMLEFCEKLSLCDDVMVVSIDNADYRAFCFAERYHATVFSAGFDAMHFDAGYGPVLRLTC